VAIADLATTCFAVQLLVGAILVIGEQTGRLRLPYGKFRTGAGVNSRAGLALAYATPVFVLSRSGLKVDLRKHRIT
jgi:hypothetical protein